MSVPAMLYVHDLTQLDAPYDYAAKEFTRQTGLTASYSIVPSSFVLLSLRCDLFTCCLCVICTTNLVSAFSYLCG